MIEIKSITKRYGRHIAVNNLELTLECGKIYGLLGPNGAGKSTTLNIITGCLSPTEGSVVINGADILSNPLEVKKNIGYLPEIPPLYNEMTPYEYISFVAKAKGISKKQISDECERVMTATGIIDVKNRLIRNLSKGYKQRVGIAQALTGEPEYIILDEPTVGLDPNQIIEIRNLIKSLSDKHTVILSSHILSEVSAVCDEVIVISHGKLIEMDTPKNLVKKYSKGNILNLTLRTEDETVISEIYEKTGCSAVIKEVCDGTIKLETDMGNNDLRDNIFFIAANLNMPIIEMTMNKPSLEDVFTELTSIEKAVREEETEDDIGIQA